MENIENIYMSILNEDIDLEADAEVNENPNLNRGSQTVINGKEVELKSLELDGVDMSDFPDFVDAYVVSGNFKDGTEMNDDEVDELNMDHPDVVQELVHDSLHEADNNNETDQEGQFAQVEELLKSFNDRMLGVGAYGEPNRAKVYGAIRNGDFKSAAEEICYSYTDQDGGEVDVQGHIKDIEDELNYIFNKQKLNEWESDDTDPESRPTKPDTYHAKGDVRRLANNTLHAKSGKIIPKDTPLSDWENLDESDIEESMVKPECWSKETNAVIDECWNEDGSIKQDCWNEDTGDTTGTTSEVTHNPEEMEQTSAYEAKNHMGEREFQTYAGWKRACKMIKPDANFTGDRDIDGCEIGEWDGAVGSIFNKPTKADSK
jgi:hypothetical protein